MNCSRYARIASLLGGILLAPSAIFADDIKFYVRSDAGKDICVYCIGPWFRTGRTQPLPRFLPVYFHFYTAEDNLFSPFGAWACGLRAATAQEIKDNECAERGYLPSKTAFCVRNSPGVSVRLSINANESISSDKPAPPCNGAGAAAFMGNSPAAQASPGQIQGAYRFAGTAGETIKVTFTRDGARGSEGDFAQVSIGQENGAILHKIVAAVPITLGATLPGAGNYRIEIASPSDTGLAPFRGYYQLDVTSTSGQPVLLEPILGASGSAPK